MDAARLKLGARSTPTDGTRFLVWAPQADAVDVRLIEPHERLLPMELLGGGYFTAVDRDVGPGTRYFYRLPWADRPDPASRLQPDGVHGPSQVVSDEFAWADAPWRGIPLSDYVLYELHVGTFTPQGTLDAVIGALDDLKKLGVTAVELMPMAEFPGVRNWGYDGAYPFSVHAAYGGPAALKRLVNACHQREMAVVLDVVYNHLGPEGTYLGEFGTYFTPRYRTAWGAALNFDGPASDEVRRYFIENALMWINEFHIDALRLDAVHAIFDFSARPFLRELAAAVHARAAELDREVFLIVESNLNDPRLVEPLERGGFNLDAQWLEDFQRAAHALLTGERQGSYCDFGSVDALSKAYREGFLLTGQYSKYRGRRYGASSAHLASSKFVAFLQTHDYVGNRGGGERIGHLVDFESQKLAGALVILSPYVPLIFMGEEYGEAAPFFYFTSHLDASLIEAVRAGRARDLATYQQQSGAPDPQAVDTFERSRLNWDLRKQGRHAVLCDFYRELLVLRRGLPAIRFASRRETRVSVVGEELLMIERRLDGSSTTALFHLGQTVRVANTAELRLAGKWKVALDSAAEPWAGPGNPNPLVLMEAEPLRLAPRSCILLVQENEDGVTA